MSDVLIISSSLVIFFLPIVQHFQTNKHKFYLIIPKVNLVTLLTGVSHEKLNTIHRWAGWIMFIIATLHTIPFFLQEHREGIVHSKFYTIGAYEVFEILNSLVLNLLT